MSAVPGGPLPPAAGDAAAEIDAATDDRPDLPAERERSARERASRAGAVPDSGSPGLVYADSLEQLERNAEKLAESVDKMLDSLRERMFKFSRVTLESVAVYRLSVDELCRAVNESAKRTLELVTTCDELNEEFVPVRDLALRIKALKQTLDVLESTLR